MNSPLRDRENIHDAPKLDADPRRVRSRENALDAVVTCRCEPRDELRSVDGDCAHRVVAPHDAAARERSDIDWDGLPVDHQRGCDGERDGAEGRRGDTAEAECDSGAAGRSGVDANVCDLERRRHVRSTAAGDLSGGGGRGQQGDDEKKEVVHFLT